MANGVILTQVTPGGDRKLVEIPARIWLPSIIESFVFVVRSLSEAHDPPPAGNITPDRGLPSGPIALTNRTPPLARTANSLDEAELKS